MSFEKVNIVAVLTKRLKVGIREKMHAQGPNSDFVFRCHFPYKLCTLLSDLYDFCCLACSLNLKFVNVYDITA